MRVNRWVTKIAARHEAGPLAKLRGRIGTVYGE
jgi:hypothetical protein